MGARSNTAVHVEPIYFDAVPEHARPVIGGGRDATATATVGQISERAHQAVSGDTLIDFQRQLARIAPPDEYESLLAQHSVLAERKFSDGLSVSETRKMRMIEWALDRLEDAKYGASVDRLRTLTEVHVGFAEKVNQLVSALTPIKGRSASPK